MKKQVEQMLKSVYAKRMQAIEGNLARNNEKAYKYSMEAIYAAIDVIGIVAEIKSDPLPPHIIVPASFPSSMDALLFMKNVVKQGMGMK